MSYYYLGVAPITKNKTKKKKKQNKQKKKQKTKKANDSAKSNVIVSEYSRINSKK